MTRFETGPMNKKPTTSDHLKTKQTQNKKLGPKKIPHNSGLFFAVFKK